MYWDDQTLSVEPYERVQKHYFCGRDLLKFREGKDKLYTILVIDFGGCCCAEVYSDGEIRVLFSKTSLVPNKHKKGGQSASRFARLRDGAITAWFKEVNEWLKPVGGPLIVGISSIYERRFLGHLSTYNQDKVKQVRSSTYNDVSGVYDLVNALEREKG